MKKSTEKSPVKIPDGLEKEARAQSLFRMRLMCLAAGCCSILFYFLMTEISPDSFDHLGLRLVVSLIALTGLVITYISQSPKVLTVFRLLISLSFILFYLYLLQMNDWSVLHRWSYFDVTAIMISVSFTWLEFLISASVGVCVPLILGFWGPLKFFELLHFHGANLVTFSVIGIAVRANFNYQEQVHQLINKQIIDSKLSAIAVMAAGVAHEINNPLNIALGHLHTAKRMILKQGPTPEQAEQTNLKIEKSEHALHRITKIVADLLDFAQRKQQAPPTPADLGLWLSEQIEVFRSCLAGYHVDLQMQTPAVALISKVEAQSVLNVVLTNAIDALQGEVNPWISVTLEQTESATMICITNGGPVLPQEIHDKIFDPFFTTKEVGRGVGLGLSAARGIMRNMNGDLFLKPGPHTTLCLQFSNQ